MAIEVRNLIYIPEATIGTTPVDDAGWKTFRANVDKPHSRTANSA